MHFEFLRILRYEFVRVFGGGFLVSRLFVFGLVFELISPINALGIVNGIPIKNSMYPSVVKFSNKATGTIVGPSTVITAAHVVLSRQLDDFDDSFGLILPDGREAYPKNIFVLKEFLSITQTDPLNKALFDVAILVFDPVDLAKFSLKENEFINLSETAPEIGDNIEVIGYGATDTSNRRKRRFGFGEKRFGHNVVEFFDNNRIVLNGTAIDEKTGKESVGGPGDSGGPILNKDGDLIAITSHGLNPGANEPPNLIGFLVDGELSWDFVASSFNNKPWLKELQSTVYTNIISDKIQILLKYASGELAKSSGIFELTSGGPRADNVL